MDANSFLEAIAASWVYDLLALGTGVLVAILRAKYPRWGNIALYGLAGVALTMVITFTFTGRGLMSREQPQTTPENVKANIKAWCDYWGFGIQPLPDIPAMHFAMSVHLPRSQRDVLISRPKDHDHYLQFESNVVLEKEWNPITSKLSKNQAIRAKDEVLLELATAKIGFQLAYFNIGNQQSPAVLLQKLVPITGNLTQDVFIEDINEVDNASVLTLSAVRLAIEHNMQPATYDPKQRPEHLP
jgi:hypothetical protein